MAPGVIVLISTDLDGMFDVMQKSEHKEMAKLQRKFCTSMDLALYWAVSAAFPECTIPSASFKKHKGQYVLVGQEVVCYNVVSM